MFTLKNNIFAFIFSIMSPVNFTLAVWNREGGERIRMWLCSWNV